METTKPEANIQHDPSERIHIITIPPEPLPQGTNED